MHLNNKKTVLVKDVDLDTFSVLTSMLGVPSMLVYCGRINVCCVSMTTQTEKYVLSDKCASLN